MSEKLIKAIRDSMVEGYARFGPLSPDDYRRVRCPDCYGIRRTCLLCNGVGEVVVSKDYLSKHPSPGRGPRGEVL